MEDVTPKWQQNLHTGSRWGGHAWPWEPPPSLHLLESSLIFGRSCQSRKLQLLGGERQWSPRKVMWLFYLGWLYKYRKLKYRGWGELGGGRATTLGEPSGSNPLANLRMFPWWWANTNWVSSTWRWSHEWVCVYVCVFQSICFRILFSELMCI